MPTGLTFGHVCKTKNGNVHQHKSVLQEISVDANCKEAGRNAEKSAR